MRVRTGRFRRSRDLSPVVKVHPLLPHVGDTLFPQPRLGQGALDDAIARHPPIPFATPRGEVDLVARDAQGEQMASAGARPFPLFPVAQPDPPPQPLVQLDHLRIAAAVAEVLEPARDLPFERCKTGGHRLPVAPCGDLTDPLLEPCDGGISPVQLPASQLEAEEAARAQTCGLALTPVDPQA